MGGAGGGWGLGVGGLLWRILWDAAPSVCVLGGLLLTDTAPWARVYLSRQRLLSLSGGGPHRRHLPSLAAAPTSCGLLSTGVSRRLGRDLRLAWAQPQGEPGFINRRCFHKLFTPARHFHKPSPNTANGQLPAEGQLFILPSALPRGLRPSGPNSTKEERTPKPPSPFGPNERWQFECEVERQRSWPPPAD